MSPPPSPERDDSDSIHAAKAAAVLGAIFTIAALGLAGGCAALSVAMGALIGIANLLTMRALIRALLRVPPEGPPAKEAHPDGDDGSESSPAKPPISQEEPSAWGAAAWGLFAVFKIFILFGGIWILLTRDLVDPIPLVVGYGVLPLGIAASSLWSSFGPRRR